MGVLGRRPAVLGGFSSEIPRLRWELGRDLGVEQKCCWCLTLAGAGRGLYSRAQGSSTRSNCVPARERTESIDLVTREIIQKRVMGCVL